MADTGRPDDRRVAQRAESAPQGPIDDGADGWHTPGGSPGTPRKPPLPRRPAIDGPRSSVGQNATSGELVDEGELPEKTPRPARRVRDRTPPPRVKKPGPRSPNPILPTRTPQPLQALSDSPEPVVTAQKPGREEDATELMIDLPAGLRDVRGDATELMTDRAAPSMVGSPTAPTLPRERGVFGDVRYVYTVLNGVTEARGELSHVREKLEEERALRDDRLLQLAREAAADPALELPSVKQARDRLAGIEEERSRDAGILASVESESAQLTREHGEAHESRMAEIAEHEVQRAEIEQKLVPLEQRLAHAGKQGDELRSALDALDEQIRRLEAKIASGKGDATATQARLASMRAEREAVARDTPDPSRDANRAMPTIKRMRIQRDKVQAEIDGLRQRDQDSGARLEAALNELRQQKADKERAVHRADQARNDLLRGLGEKLCLERPERLSLLLRRVDHHDVQIATMERRAMELEDLVQGVDRSKLVRGLLILIAAAAIPVAVVIALL